MREQCPFVLRASVVRLRQRRLHTKLVVCEPPGLVVLPVRSSCASSHDAPRITNTHAHTYTRMHEACAHASPHACPHTGAYMFKHIGGLSDCGACCEVPHSRSRPHRPPSGMADIVHGVNRCAVVHGACQFRHQLSSGLKRGSSGVWTSPGSALFGFVEAPLCVCRSQQCTLPKFLPRVAASRKWLSGFQF